MSILPPHGFDGTPIIGPESPFERVPGALPYEQRLWFEAYRFAAVSADAAMTTLVRILAQIQQEESGLDREARHITPAFVAAWSFVDSAWRLREILTRSPQGGFGNSNALPRLEIRVGKLLEALKPLKNLRHAFQHLENNISKLAKAAEPTLGRLRWIGVGTGGHSIHRGVLVLGPLPVGESAHQFTAPFNKTWIGPVADIDLTSMDSTVHILDIYGEIKRTTRDMEQVLTILFGEAPAGPRHLRFVLTAVRDTNSP